MKKYFSKIPAILFAFFILLPGCGKKEESAQLTVPLTSQENVPVPSPAALSGNGEIRGRVMFNGVPPQAEKLDMGADPVCAGAHQEPVYAQDLEVNPDHSIRNAFVYIKSGLPPGASYPVPAEPVTLDQNGCRYSPHVLGVRVNQPVVIMNSDATLHNVHGVFQKTPEFNLGMPLKGMKNTKKFSAPEVMAHFKCDVHPWMSAYVGVVENPYFTVTGGDGSFDFKGLPAGNYMLQIWQEKFGFQATPVEVSDKGASEVTVNYGSPS